MSNQPTRYVFIVQNGCPQIVFDDTEPERFERARAMMLVEGISFSVHDTYDEARAAWVAWEGTT